MGGTPEKFVPSGVEVHLGQGGIKIDSLDFIQKLAGGGFLFFLCYAVVAGVVPLAQEAAGIMKERRDFFRSVSAWITDRAAQDVPRNAEGRAGIGLAKRFPEERHDSRGKSLEGVFHIHLGVFRAEFLNGIKTPAGEDIAQIVATGGDTSA